MGYLSPTERAVATTPLPANPTSAQVVNWINRVVPCGRPGFTQSAADTKVVVGRLRDNGVPDHTISDALGRTGYKWATAGLFLAGPIPPPRPASRHARMGTAAKPDRSWMKTKAAELGTIYAANGHNPEVQAKAWAELQALLGQLDTPGDGDPMPGRGRMESDRERLRKVMAEILANAGELGRQMSLQLGPLGVHRARGGFMPTPDRPDTPYRPPNLRTGPRR